MKISARAPGKLVLLGEYAVLEGAPALVMAVDRQARVEIDKPGGDGLQVSAPPLQAAPVTAAIRGRDLVWPNDAARVPLVDAVVGSLAAAGVAASALAGLSLRLDTGDFYTAGGLKLGLGSSAALTTALLGALCAAIPGCEPPGLDQALAAHARFQHGLGSGIDVAASFAGGVLRFSRPPGGPARAEPLSWPPSLHGCGVFSGHAASTPVRLERLTHFRATRPAAYRESMAELERQAAAGVAAFAGADVAAFLDAAGAFVQALAELERRAALGIDSRSHRELRTIGDRCRVLYKTSGAGGGDFGLAFSEHPRRLQRFVAEAERAGRRTLPLRPCAAGLRVQVDGTGP